MWSTGKNNNSSAEQVFPEVRGLLCHTRLSQAQRASGLALSGVSRVAHTQELWSVCGFQEVLGLQHSHAVTDPRDTP